MSAGSSRFGAAARPNVLRASGILVALLVLVAVPRQAAPGVRAVYGGEVTVVLESPPREIDPARAILPADLAAVRAIHATLLEVDASGALRPALLAALPEVDPTGRIVRLRLRPGLRFHDGSPITAADVAASLSRLLHPAIGSPHAWIALPIDGAQSVREGRARTLSGIQVVSRLELRILLSSPFPEFVYALATPPSAVLPRNTPPWIGAGDFRVVSLAAYPSGTLPGQIPLSADGTLRMVPFDGHWRGKPFLDGLTLAGLDPHRAERAFERGGATLALLPEALPRSRTVKMPALSATYAVVNRNRVGVRAQEVHRILASLDRPELIRLFVRGAAEPLVGLLPPVFSPPGLRPSPAPSGRGKTSGAADVKLTLLICSGVDFHRAVADRLQVKLFDQGITVAVEAPSPAFFTARVARGDFDLALVPMTFLTTDPVAAQLQASFTIGGVDAARAVLRSRAAGDRKPTAASVFFGGTVSVVPLYVAALSASAHPSISEGLSILPDGRIDMGGLWILPESKGR
jgi:ABC-type transport system substrate-binding protein